MSRIGKLPVTLPGGVNLQVNGQVFEVSGPKGKITFRMPHGTELKTEGQVVNVVSEDSRVQGLVKTHLANAVTGVSGGFSKSLELAGTGYRAAVSGSNLQMSLGYSHQVTVTAPAGISFVVKDNLITVSGHDKSLVGEIAAKIRAKRPADPYKAKGLKYEKEVIVRKAGKAAKAGGGK